MRSQRLIGPPEDSVTSAISGLLAVQAENHSQASWAVACRTIGTTESDFARLFDEGAILRTHVMRPTWHFVVPDDIRWLVDLTAPRVRATYRQGQRELDVSDADLEASAELIVGALSGGRHLTRRALGERLHDAGLPGEGRALGLVTGFAELSGLICSGPMDGTHHTYALLEERAPNARRLPRDEALAELALRYFGGHGPATERDLAYWATQTLTDVRAGLAAVRDRLEHFDHDGRTYWFDPERSGPDLAPPRSSMPSAHLLQILDEYHHGYQESRWSLDAAGIVPRGRPTSIGMVLVDGQMVGDLQRDVQTESVRFDVRTHRPLDEAEIEAVTDEALRYGDFLEREATVTFNG